MPQQTPLFIVASQHPRVGKTLIARLLIEFFRSQGRPVAGYDLDPREPTLAGYFPKLVDTVDIADTQGQMALFDRLLANDRQSTVIDLGYGVFEQFFKVMAEIGFEREALRCGIEPIVLFPPTPRRPPRATTPSCAAACRKPRSFRCITKRRRSCSSRRTSADAARMRRPPYSAALADRARRNRPAGFFVRRLHGEVLKPQRRTWSGISLIPAKARIQFFRKRLGPRFRGGMRRTNRFRFNGLRSSPACAPARRAS